LFDELRKIAIEKGTEIFHVPSSRNVVANKTISKNIDFIPEFVYSVLISAMRGGIDEYHDRKRGCRALENIQTPRCFIV
jgi:hypothetical protein